MLNDEISRKNTDGDAMPVTCCPSDILLSTVIAATTSGCNRAAAICRDFVPLLQEKEGDQ